MATVNFLYRSTKNKASLTIRLLYRHEEIDYVIGAKTKYEVEKHYWTKQHKKKKTDPEIKNKQIDVNTDLNKIENHVLNAFNKVEPSEINKQWLEDSIELYYNPPKKIEELPKRLVSYFDIYIEARKDENKIKLSSIKKLRVVQRKLERMEKHLNKTILISDVNENFKNDLKKYQESQNYANTTLQRDLVFIKSICYHAKRKGLKTHPELDELSFKRERIGNVYLTFKEIEKIEKLTDLPQYLENAKDWLIISCFTGQRVSDFLNFTSDIIRKEDGKELLEFEQQKTSTLMTVPIHPKVREILNKRNGEFPRKISDQKYNEYIKEVCKRAEINSVEVGSKKLEIEPNSKRYRNVSGNYEKWELISSHVGRRSFASNFYGKIPTTYLIYITGHSTEASFLQYIHKKNKDLAMEASNYFEALHNK